MLVLYLNVLCFLSVWQASNAIAGTLEPEVNHVLEGGTAEFTCTVTGRNQETQDILWNGISSKNYIYWEYSATSQRVIQGELGLSENVKFYYNITNGAEVFILRITNVTKTDHQSSAPLTCAYRNSTGVQKSFLDAAKVEIWVKPECSYEGYLPITISSHDSHWIDLFCTIDGGNPLPQLTWYQMNQNDLIRVSDPNYFSVRTDLNINASYHGHEYVCQADTAAVLNENLSCTIIPYNPMPEIDVTSEKLIYTIGERISIYCNNTGVSTTDTYFLWYINNILIDASIHDEIVIMNTLLYSKISISNYSFPPDNAVVITCEGVIPNVASANASLSFTVKHTNGQATTEPIFQTTMTETPSEQAPNGPTLIIIAVAAAGGSFVVIVIVIIVCCACMKCKNFAMDNDTGHVETPSAEVTITSSQGTSDRSPMNLSNNESKSTEGKKSQKDNMVPLYAAVSKVKNSDIPLYADVSKVKNSDKVKANAEGLAYADIEIASKAQGKAGKDEIIRTENATVYAEVKV